ncbi:SipW-dependent-type signal peptide-containing protein [Haloarchaeobius baliensis]|uniref:SipW-dependent-type signal peptide-containing protein n=1 Tax=Haloarchaeobius baliensis TaxID=1670458 RepID=UPI003F881F4D
MSENPIAFSRRKLLLGVGAAGAASAGAGLGTSAYFSDTESFVGNELVAGQLDLVVDYYTDREQGSYGVASDQGEVNGDGEATYTYAVEDLKPGDSGTLVFCPKLVDNDGWLWVGGDGVVDYENGQSEPEASVDPSGGGSIGGENDGMSAGELSDAIEVDLAYCEDVGIADGVVDIGTVVREFDNPDGYSLADLAKDLESGVLLDGDGTGATADPYPGSPDADTQNGPCLCVEWTVPEHVGNEIQTDAVAFGFTFAAVQSRHNGDPANPFVDITVGPGDGFDYTSIQDGVDAASAGDVVGVAAGTFSEQVTITTEDLTLASARGAMPVVEGPGGGSTSATISIAADGVTVDGFEVTNPSGLLGVKVEENVDDATVCNNLIRDVGPTGSLGVTGIVVGNGDHRNVSIVGNTIEDLYQTDDGSFATLNGILFDAAGSPGTVTDTRIERNVVQNLQSTTAPLGIVVQHTVESMEIADNVVSGLTADNSLGPGSFTTFAQGLSVDSTSITGMRFVGNVVEDVVSEDGFFGEAIKLEPGVEVGGITIQGNDLLSAIGLNNADGANPTVTAEGNYWGASGGPLVIQNNSDSGTVPVSGGGSVDLDTVTESAVTENVDFEPFESGSTA